MTLEERYAQVTAVAGASIYEKKRAVVAPGLTLVEVSIVWPTADADVSNYEERKLTVQTLEGVAVAAWFGKKPSVLTENEPAENPNPGPEATDDDIRAFVESLAAADGQKIQRFSSLRRIAATADVSVVVTDGIGFFERFWIVSDGDGKTLEAHERKAQ